MLALRDYALIALATFFASLVSGLGGFGGGFIIAVVMTPIVGAKSLVPLMSVFALFSNFSRVLAYRHTIAWSNTAVFLVASTPGVFLGTHFFSWAPERLLLALLGVVLIGCVPLRWILKRRRLNLSGYAVVAVAVLFGFMSGTAVGSGTLAIAALMGTGLQGGNLLGTDATIGLVNSITRVISFRRLGLLSDDIVLAGTLMGIMTLPGTFIAKTIVDRIGLERHTRLIELVVVSGGVIFIGRALIS